MKSDTPLSRANTTATATATTTTTPSTPTITTTTTITTTPTTTTPTTPSTPTTATTPTTTTPTSTTSTTTTTNTTTTRNWSETGLKHLPAHHLRLYAPWVAASLLCFAFQLQERFVPFACFSFIAGAFRRAMAVFKFSLFSGKRAKPREPPQRGLKPVWNHSETPSGSPSQTLFSFGYRIIALFCFSVAGRMCYFVCFGFIAGPFRWAMAVFKFSLFSGKRAKPREHPQKGLKPLWNTFRLTISDSMLLRLQHHCFVLLFSCRKDLFFLYVLVSLPEQFEGQWPCLSSASFPGKGQSPVSAPKRVWNRSETTLKHLLAHHLRLYAPLVTASLLCFAFLLQERCVILYVLVSLPDLFDGQWPCSSSASFPETGQKPGECPQRVWNRSGTAGNCSPSQTLCLSGPPCLQLEYVLGACFSGPLHVFPDRNVYN